MERFRKISSTASGLNIAEPVQFFSGRTSCVCKPSAMSRLKFGHFLPLSTARRIEPLFHAALGRLRFPGSNLRLGLTGISSSAPLNWRELKAQPDSRICTAAVHGYHKPYLSRTREKAALGSSLFLALYIICRIFFVHVKSGFEKVWLLKRRGSKLFREMPNKFAKSVASNKNCVHNGRKQTCCFIAHK